MTKFTINEAIDFTPSSLRDYLNHKFGCKSNQSIFNNQDIQQYTKRGFLPIEYGGHTIEVIPNERFGLKILRIKDINKQTNADNKG